MSDFNTIATAANFETIEAEVIKYFQKPKRLDIQSHGLWKVCNPDGSPFGSVNSYHVIRQGARYHFFSRSREIRPIIHRGELVA